MKSDKTYDEVLAFLDGGTKEKKDGVKTNGRGGRKTKRTDR